MRIIIIQEPFKYSKSAGVEQTQPSTLSATKFHSPNRILIQEGFFRSGPSHFAPNSGIQNTFRPETKVSTRRPSSRYQRRF
jgi:hypothetical protein